MNSGPICQPWFMSRSIFWKNSSASRNMCDGTSTTQARSSTITLSFMSSPLLHLKLYAELEPTPARLLRPLTPLVPAGVHQKRGAPVRWRECPPDIRDYPTSPPARGEGESVRWRGSWRGRGFRLAAGRCRRRRLQQVLDRRAGVLTLILIYGQQGARRVEPAALTLVHEFTQHADVLFRDPVLIGRDRLGIEMFAHAGEVGEIKMQRGGVVRRQQGGQGGQAVGENVAHRADHDFHLRDPRRVHAGSWPRFRSRSCVRAPSSRRDRRSSNQAPAPWPRSCGSSAVPRSSPTGNDVPIPAGRKSSCPATWPAGPPGRAHIRTRKYISCSRRVFPF